MNTNRCTLYIKTKIVADRYKQIVSDSKYFKIAYAIKANPHKKIIKKLHQEKSFFETASLSEILDLLKQGISSKKIIFSNPVKEINTIKTALDNQVLIHSFDSLEELKKYKKIDRQNKAKLLLRIAVANKGSIWPLSGKFGVPKKYFKTIFSYMQKNNIPLAGITFHVGSQCENDDNWHKAMQKTKKAYLLAKRYNLHPYILNIGGGFPIHLGRKISSTKKIFAIIDSYIRQWKKEKIIFQEFYAEPGRFIVGEAGTLETQVIGIAKRKKNKWVFLNCGVFNGMMEVIDGITYPMSFSGKQKLEEVILCGPSCDSMDRIYKTKMPLVQVNDKIFFHGTGAYTTVYSSNFNGFNSPQIKFIS